MNDLLLVLNAAEGRVQNVLLEDGVFLCAQEWNAPSRGTEFLTPLLVDMFQRTKHKPSEITRLACVSGPGSFTGLRLVLSTAAALRRATGCRVASLNSLALLATTLALSGFSTDQPCRVRVITYARRGLVHGQDFLFNTPDLPIPLTAPAMLDIKGIFADPLPKVIIGSGVSRNLEFLRQQKLLLDQQHTSQETPEHEKSGNLQNIQLLPNVCDQSSTGALAKMAFALPESAWQNADIEPLYLRSCDAVDNLAAIASKRGDNPDQAYADLKRLLAKNPEEIFH